MQQGTTQWLGLGLGIALIVVYSVIMITTSGSAGAAWLLLVAGIGVLIATGVAGTRKHG